MRPAEENVGFTIQTAPAVQVKLHNYFSRFEERLLGALRAVIK